LACCGITAVRSVAELSAHARGEQRNRYGQKDADPWSKSGLSNIVLKSRSKAGRGI